MEAVLYGKPVPRQRNNKALLQFAVSILAMRDHNHSYDQLSAHDPANNHFFLLLEADRPLRLFIDWSHQPLNSCDDISDRFVVSPKPLLQFDEFLGKFFIC